MKRLNSLKGRTIFRAIFLDGVRFQKRGIRLFMQRSSASVICNEQLTPYNGRNIRIGISISKRLGRAHDRNWMKRRIRAICRDYLPAMNADSYFIIRFEREALQVSFLEQKRIIRSLLIKAGIISQDTGNAGKDL